MARNYALQIGKTQTKFGKRGTGERFGKEKEATTMFLELAGSYPVIYICTNGGAATHTPVTADQ